MAPTCGAACALYPFLPTDAHAALCPHPTNPSLCLLFLLLLSPSPRVQPETQIVPIPRGEVKDGELQERGVVKPPQQERRRPTPATSTTWFPLRRRRARTGSGLPNLWHWTSDVSPTEEFDTETESPCGPEPRHQFTSNKLRMPCSLVGCDLAVPDMARSYMKKDDDDEDH
jgi:hypothetical protein